MKNEAITWLINYALNKNLIAKEDKTYAINRILSLIDENSYEYKEGNFSNIEEVLQILAPNDNIACQIMDVFTPRPKEIIDTFNSKAAQNATDWFYKLSQDTNYIMTERVKKDIRFLAHNGLIITINLSKPEKDPKEIAKAKTLAQSGYPKCMLCTENEGYVAGARANHRIVPINLCGERWFFQYSPYVYYNEHCIILNEKHTPMVIDRSCFQKLLDFVTQFPHYFVGSNADLPIVGGSILTHEHFQGGNADFPMANVAARVAVGDFEILNWALSTVRIKSDNKEKLISLAQKLLDAWRTYNDEENEIISYTDAPHNTVTPIARMRNGLFELDLILRNNRTSAEHPLGIFHPHSEYHHIKKENIGLIEAMGLAVLPSRLTKELDLSSEKVRTEISDIFMKILENCAVFKNDEKGNKGFIKFLRGII